VISRDANCNDIKGAKCLTFRVGDILSSKAIRHNILFLFVYLFDIMSLFVRLRGSFLYRPSHIGS
jgi:hypothetical protein